MLTWRSERRPNPHSTDCILRSTIFIVWVRDCKLILTHYQNFATWPPTDTYFMSMPVKLSCNGIFISLDNLIKVVGLGRWAECARRLPHVFTWSCKASEELGGICAITQALCPASSAAWSSWAANVRIPLGSGLWQNKFLIFVVRWVNTLECVAVKEPETISYDKPFLRL